MKNPKTTSPLWPWAIVIALLLACLAAMVVNVWEIRGLKESMLWSLPSKLDIHREPEWEYTIASPTDETFPRIMAEYGAAGWELVSARRAGENMPGIGTVGIRYEVILKRRPKTPLAERIEFYKSVELKMQEERDQKRRLGR